VNRLIDLKRSAFVFIEAIDFLSDPRKFGRSHRQSLEEPNRIGSCRITLGKIREPEGLLRLYEGDQVIERLCGFGDQARLARLPTIA